MKMIAHRCIETDESRQRLRQRYRLFTGKGRFSNIIICVAMKAAFDNGRGGLLLIAGIILVMYQPVVQGFLGCDAERKQ